MISNPHITVFSDARPHRSRGSRPKPMMNKVLFVAGLLVLFVSQSLAAALAEEDEIKGHDIQKRGIDYGSKPRYYPQPTGYKSYSKGYYYPVYDYPHYPYYPYDYYPYGYPYYGYGYDPKFDFGRGGFDGRRIGFDRRKGGFGGKRVHY